MKGNHGSAVMMALIFGFAASVAVGGYLSLVNGQSRILKRYSNGISAFYLGESGINKAIIELEKYPSPPAVFPAIDATELGDGTYMVEEANAAYEGDNITYEIHSIGNVNGVEKEVIAEIQAETFAKWSYFTDTENYMIHFWWRRRYYTYEVPVWFTTGAYLEGPVHTNGQFNVSGYPVFNGPVSSVADSLNYMHGPDEDGMVFYNESLEDYDSDRDAKFEPDELSLGVDGIDMSFLNADRLREGAALSDGMTLTGDTTITLKDDGTMEVTNSALGWHKEVVALPDNGALFVNGGDLDISGTLNGALTVGASGDVIITDDVTYADDPRLDDEISDDKLGIIAEQNVIISETAPQNPDPPDPNGVSVHASIIALNESFTVERYWSGMKHVLSVTGGIIQKRRGPVGTFNPATNEKVSGYDKNYQYDSRMRYSPPPFFPKTGEYEMVYWKEGE